MDIKILVAAHKEAKMPTDKNLYLPIHVGAALHPELRFGYQSDATGDNISLKNASMILSIKHKLRRILNCGSNF